MFYIFYLFFLSKHQLVQSSRATLSRSLLNDVCYMNVRIANDWRLSGKSSYRSVQEIIYAGLAS